MASKRIGALLTAFATILTIGTMSFGQFVQAAGGATLNIKDIDQYLINNHEMPDVDKLIEYNFVGKETKSDYVGDQDSINRQINAYFVGAYRDKFKRVEISYSDNDNEEQSISALNLTAVGGDVFYLEGGYDYNANAAEGRENYAVCWYIKDGSSWKKVNPEAESGDLVAHACRDGYPACDYTINSDGSKSEGRPTVLDKENKDKCCEFTVKNKNGSTQIAYVVYVKSELLDPTGGFKAVKTVVCNVAINKNKKISGDGNTNVADSDTEYNTVQGTTNISNKKVNNFKKLMTKKGSKSFVTFTTNNKGEKILQFSTDSNAHKSIPSGYSYVYSGVSVSRFQKYSTTELFTSVLTAKDRSSGLAQLGTYCETALNDGGAENSYKINGAKTLRYETCGRADNILMFAWYRNSGDWDSRGAKDTFPKDKDTIFNKFKVEDAEKGKISIDVKSLLSVLSVDSSYDDGTSTITYKVSNNENYHTRSWGMSLLKMFARTKTNDVDKIGHMYVGIDFTAHLIKNDEWNIYRDDITNKRLKANAYENFSNNIQKLDGEDLGNKLQPVPDFGVVRLSTTETENIDHQAFIGSVDNDYSSFIINGQPRFSHFYWNTWEYLKYFMYETSGGTIVVPDDKVYMIADLANWGKSTNDLDMDNLDEKDAGIRSITHNNIIKNMQQTSDRQALNNKLMNAGEDSVLFSEYNSLNGGRNIYPNVYASGENENLAVASDTTVKQILRNQRSSGLNDTAPGIYVWNEALDEDGDGNADYVIGADPSLIAANILGNTTRTDIENQLAEASAYSLGHTPIAAANKFSFNNTDPSYDKNQWKTTVSDNNAIPAGENIKTTVEADTWYGKATIGAMKQMIPAGPDKDGNPGCNVNIYCQQLSVKWNYTYRHGPSSLDEILDVIPDVTYYNYYAKDDEDTHGWETDSPGQLKIRGYIETDDEGGNVAHEFSYWKNLGTKHLELITWHTTDTTASGTVFHPQIHRYWESGCTRRPKDGDGDRLKECTGHTETITTVYVASGVSPTAPPEEPSDDEELAAEYSEILESYILCGFSDFNAQISKIQSIIVEIEGKITNFETIRDDEDSTEEQKTNAEERIAELEKDKAYYKDLIGKITDYKDHKSETGKNKANNKYTVLSFGGIEYPDLSSYDSPDLDLIKFNDTRIKFGDEVVLYFYNYQTNAWDTMTASYVINGCAGFDYRNEIYNLDEDGNELYTILNDNVILARKASSGSSSTDESVDIDNVNLGPLSTRSYKDTWNNSGNASNTAFSTTYPIKVGIGRAMKNDFGDYSNADTELSYNGKGWFIKYRFCGVSYILSDLNVYGINSWETNYIRHDTDYAVSANYAGVISSGDMFSGVAGDDGGDDISIASEWLFNEDAIEDESDELWITTGKNIDTSLEQAAENQEIGYYINTIDGRTLRNDPNESGLYIGQELDAEQYYEYFDRNDCNWINGAVQNYFDSHRLSVSYGTVSHKRRGWKITDDMIDEIDNAINKEAKKAVYNGISALGNKHLYVRFHNDTFVLDGVEYLSDSTYNEGFYCSHGEASGKDHVTLIYGSVKKGFASDHDATEYTNHPGYIITFNDVNKNAYSNFMLPSTGWKHNAWILNLKHVNGDLDTEGLYSHQIFYSFISRGLQPLFALDNFLEEAGGMMFVNAKCGDWFSGKDWETPDVDRIQDNNFITKCYSSTPGANSLWGTNDTMVYLGKQYGKAPTSECIKYINSGEDNYLNVPNHGIYGDGHELRAYRSTDGIGKEWGYNCTGNIPVRDDNDPYVYLCTNDYVISSDHYGNLNNINKITKAANEANATVREDAKEITKKSQHAELVKDIVINNDVVTWPIVHTIPESASNGYYYTSVTVTYKSVFQTSNYADENSRYNKITINNFNDSYAGLLSNPKKLKTTGEIPTGKIKTTNSTYTVTGKYEGYKKSHINYLFQNAGLTVDGRHFGKSTNARNNALKKEVVDIKNNYPFMGYGEYMAKEAKNVDANSIYRYTSNGVKIEKLVGDGLQNGQGWNRAIPSQYFDNEPLRIHSVASAPITITSDGLAAVEGVVTLFQENNYKETDESGVEERSLIFSKIQLAD